MQFEAALCHMDRLYERFRDNRLAWAELLEQTCRAPRSKRKFKDTAKCLVELVLTFIGIMDGEGDVERMFSRLQLVEVNRRKRHHKEETLMDIMKIGADGPGFELESMVTLAPEPLPGSDPHAPVLRFMWRPKPLLVSSQIKYAEFYGTRNLASRDQAPATLEERARQMLTVRRRFSRTQRTRKVAQQPLTRKDRQQQWSVGARALVSDMHARRPPRPTLSGSQPDSASEPGIVVQEVCKSLQRRRKLDAQEWRRAEQLHGLAPPPKPFQTKRTVDKIKREHGLAPPPKAKPQSQGTASSQPAKPKCGHGLAPPPKVKPQSTGTASSPPAKRQRGTASDQTKAKPQSEGTASSQLAAKRLRGTASDHTDVFAVWCKVREDREYCRRHLGGRNEIVEVVDSVDRAEFLVLPSDGFEQAIKHSPASLHARFMGKTLVTVDWFKTEGANGETAKFTPPRTDMSIFCTPTVVKKHPKYYEILQQLAENDNKASSPSLSLTTTTTRQEVTAALEEMLDRPEACHWIVATNEVEEFWGVIERHPTRASRQLAKKVVKSMEEFCEAIGEVLP